MPKQRRVQSALLPASPLLITESEDEFDRIRDAFDQELKPRGIIEQMYVADIAYLAWEILRLRRCKAGIINVRVPPGLGRTAYAVFAAARRVTCAWKMKRKVWREPGFLTRQAKKQVKQLLKNFQLDEIGH